MNELSPMSLDPAFQGDARAAALEILTDILGTEQAKAAATRIAVALNVLAKRNPDVYGCDPQSIGECIAACALSGLMVGGSVPTCYVIPRRNFGKLELSFTLGFRGMIALAHRAGFLIEPFPVYPERVPKFDAAGRFVIPTTRQPPVNRSLDNLIGVLVKVRRMADGMDFGDHFVEADLIEERRAKSDAWQRGQHDEKKRASPWYEFEEAMMLKTAIRYVTARGMVPLDDAGQRALEYDGKRDNVIDAPSESVAQTREQPARGRAALGMDAPKPDLAADLARLDRRETIPVQRAANAPAKQEQAAQVKETPAAPARPRMSKSTDPVEVLARLAKLGVTEAMAEQHVATPRAAWTTANVTELVALGVAVKAGKATIESLAVADADEYDDAQDDGEAP